jgi:hypothetical protein
MEIKMIRFYTRALFISANLILCSFTAQAMNIVDSTPTSRQSPRPTDAPASLPPATANLKVTKTLDYLHALEEMPKKYIGLTGFAKLNGQPKTIILDLRSEKLFRQKHIKGAVNLPVSILTDKTLGTLVPDKATTIILVCEHSFAPFMTTPTVLEAFPAVRALGYQTVYILQIWGALHEPKMVMPSAAEKKLSFVGEDIPQ